MLLQLRSISTLLAILQLCVLFHTEAQEGLQLEIKLNKNTYLKGELIFCEAILNNEGSQALEVINIYSQGGGLKVSLYDETGKQMRYTGFSYAVAGQSKQTINPKSFISEIVEITSFFGKRIGVSSTTKLIESGSYTIKIYYESGMGPVYEKEARFTVINPINKEAEAFELLTNTLGGTSTGRITYDEGVDRLLELEAKYPTSVYAPLALYVLPAWYKFALKDRTKGESIYLRLVEKYPISIRIPGVLKAALSSLPNASERETFADRLQNKLRVEGDEMGIRIFNKLIIEK